MATSKQEESENQSVEKTAVTTEAETAEALAEDHDDNDIDEREEDREPPKPSPLAVKKSRQAEEVTRWFATCGRCSFFLSAYQIIDGVTDLNTAVANSSTKWLQLDWNQEIRLLVHKSYGSRMDGGSFHLEGSCVECKRHFVYHDKGRGRAPTFKIQTRSI